MQASTLSGITYVKHDADITNAEHASIKVNVRAKLLLKEQQNISS